MKKIFPYILLNILVSAVTMLAVILIWNAFHPDLKPISNNANYTLLKTPEINSASLLPLDDKTVVIDFVFMPAEIDYEKITVKSVSAVPVDLTGWLLKDEQGKQYTFPALTIYPNGAVDIYSRAGVNSAVELYWNSDQAVWRKGEIATLLDTAGNVRSTLIIP